MRIHDPILEKRMEFTDKEAKIINSPTFQRLRRIKQLRSAYVAYPSATHTRFEHSLGVCYLTKIILEVIEKNGFTFDKTDKFIIPIIGLLHNITHTPFAFSLQEHLNLFPHYNSKNKYLARFNDIKLEEIIGKENTETVLNTLTTNSHVELEKPYYKQIIRDVVGSNMSDYLLRDAFYIRPDKRFDYERIIAQNCILTYQNDKYYLGLDLQSSLEILYELFNLLWIRYIFCNSIYFYPVVVAADAMIGKAFRKLIKDYNINDDFFYHRSDEEVIQFLVDHKDQIIKYLGNRLKNRDLFGKAYQIKRNEIDLAHFSKIITYLRGKSNASLVANIEEIIAKEANVSSREIAIFCHDPDMYSQEVNILVIDKKSRILPLYERIDLPEVLDIKGMVEKHERLWTIYVFCGNRDEKVIKKVREISREILSNPLVLENIIYNDKIKLSDISEPILIKKNSVIEDWPLNYRNEYLNLTKSKNWTALEKEIGKIALRDLERYEKSEINRSLGIAYKRYKDKKLNIENILIARRIVIASIWKYNSNFYKVQKLFRYGYDKRGVFSYEENRNCPKCSAKIDYYATQCNKCAGSFEELPIKKEHSTIFDDGFKKYYFDTLHLKMDIFYGRELLPEEEKWLESFRKKNKNK